MENNDKEMALANLGGVIRDIRKTNDLTQEEFAEKLEVKTNYVSMIERGERTPSLNLLADISDTFGVELHQIFLRAEMPELGGNLKRAYYLAKILDEVDFEKLRVLAEGITEDLDLEPSSSEENSREEVTH